MGEMGMEKVSSRGVISRTAWWSSSLDWAWKKKTYRCQRTQFTPCEVGSADLTFKHMDKQSHGHDTLKPRCIYNTTRHPAPRNGPQHPEGAKTQSVAYTQHTDCTLLYTEP